MRNFIYQVYLGFSKAATHTWGLLLAILGHYMTSPPMMIVSAIYYIVLIVQYFINRNTWKGYEYYINKNNKKQKGNKK